MTKEVFGGGRCMVGGEQIPEKTPAIDHSIGRVCKGHEEIFYRAQKEAWTRVSPYPKTEPLGPDNQRFAHGVPGSIRKTTRTIIRELMEAR